MRRAGIRIANVALFTFCCFLVASVFNNISAEFLMIGPALTPPPPGVESRRARSWEDRTPILERNLFGAQIVAAQTPPPPPAEDLDNTQLPLRLLGTIASANPATSRATIQDEKTNKHEVVRLGDFLQSYDQVEVAAIERGRVILLNGNRREQLRLLEDQEENSSSRKSNRKRPRRPRRSDQSSLGDLAERLRELNAGTGRGRTIPDLLAQGNLVPETGEDGRMIGMRIEDIRPGSLYEKIGLENGDLITSVNGIAIDSAAASRRILSQFTKAGEIKVELEGGEVLDVTPEVLAGMFDE